MTYREAVQAARAAGQAQAAKDGEWTDKAYKAAINAFYAARPDGVPACYDGASLNLNDLFTAEAR